ncbi:class I SAM-dependent methyltransferase [Oceanibacterium hippocampi]|uniref:class I SAM-dependent methyltransferase n=1 Tax=Oceanibacterium hippocampi TaxID=745714 RepID=UPI001C38D4CE
MTDGEMPASTAGYAAEADALVAPYEALTLEQVHRQFLDLMPDRPGRALDIGAGTGRDAAALAARGHRVVAVEPVREFRERARLVHPDPAIEWLDDALPELSRLAWRDVSFDIVMLTAVWMHLDAAERARAMPVIAGLLAPGGLLTLTIRHGTVPPGRRMFEVGTAETLGLAAANGLATRRVLENQAAIIPRPGIRWTRLAFVRPGSRRRGRSRASAQGPDQAAVRTDMVEKWRAGEDSNSRPPDS